MKRKLIIATGTGRCGTTTFADLCALQPGVRSTHESTGGMPWEGNWLAKLVVVKAFIRDAFKDHDKVVDANPSWVSYLYAMRDECLRQGIALTVVWLHRDKEDYLDSSMRWCGKTNIHRSYEIGCGRDEAVEGWQHAMPKFDMIPHEGTRDNYGRWWDYCYHARKLDCAMSGNTVSIRTDRLTDKEAMAEIICSGLGISRDDFVFQSLRSNQSSDSVPSLIEQSRAPTKEEYHRLAMSVLLAGGKVDDLLRPEHDAGKGFHITKSGAWCGATADDHQVCEELKMGIVDFCQKFGVRSAYDFGSGEGSYLGALRVAGIDAVGIEADPAMDYPAMIHRDLSKPLDGLQRRDLVLSLEVGEHIPKDREGVFLDNVTSHASKVVIISWAVPGQHGAGHINCRDNSHIRHQMRARGFSPFASARDRLRDAVPQGWFDYFKNTVMVFTRV